MGTIKQLFCKDCGAEWRLLDGAGMKITNYYCCSCNSQYSVEHPIPKNFKAPKCSCGGKYVLNPDHFVCPDCNCRSNDIEVENIGFWD